MKNLFTFIVALFMATGVYAQTYKSFTETTVLITNQTNVQSAIDEGWASAGTGITAATGSAGSVNPLTDKEENYKADGIILKSGSNTKTLTLYVKDIRYLKAYAVMTNPNDTRAIKVTATSTEGNSVVASSLVAPKSSAVVSLILDPTKKYKVDFEGYDKDILKGSDVVLHGVRFIPSSSSSSSVTIGDAGFATHASAFAVDYSNRTDGLEAYAVKYTNGTLTYNKIDGIVPANTAVLLKGEAKEYTLTAAEGEPATVDTDLKVADGTKTGANNIYCLANKNNGVGFYQVSSDVTIPKNKAYLEIGTPVTTPAKYYSIGIGGNTTGIQAIQQNGVKADGIMYSLSGQKVGANYKGIVICNGKKMIKK